MRNEIVFANLEQRCHAEIVNALPEKADRFSNGYAEIGTFTHDGKDYTIFRDRDADGAYAYFAIDTLKRFALMDEMNYIAQQYADRSKDVEPWEYSSEKASICNEWNNLIPKCKGIGMTDKDIKAIWYWHNPR